MQTIKFPFYSKVLSLNYGHFSPPLSGRYELPTSTAYWRGHEEIQEDEVSFVHGTRFLDLGGSGDCFFLCLNAAILKLQEAGLNLAAVPVDEAYEKLKLAPNTYIEESHVVSVIPEGVCLYILREFQGRIYVQSFGLGDVKIAIYNEYPRHYLLSDKAKISSDVVSFTSMTLAPSQPKITLSPQPYTVLPEDYVQPSSKFNDDPTSCVIEDVSQEYYLKYVDSRFQIRKTGKALDYMDSKSYYKIRHNLLKTIFLDQLGIASTEEKPFSLIGVDSSRTPDFLERINNTYILIEFTVVKHMATSYTTKQSKGKYDSEVSVLRSRGEKINCFYPTLALDTTVEGLIYDIRSVSNLMEKPLSQDPESVFRGLQSLILSTEFDISELMPELLINIDNVSKVQPAFTVRHVGARDRFHRMSSKLGIKRQRSQNLFSLLKKNSFKLESFLKRVYYKATFSIFVNTRTNMVYVDVSKSGVGKNKLLNLIQNLSPALLDHVVMIGGGLSIEEPFQTFGKADVSISDDRPQVIDEIPDTTDFENYYSQKLIAKSRNNPPTTLADSSLDEQVPRTYSIYMSKLNEMRQHPRVVVYDKDYFLMPCMTDATPGVFEPLNLKTGLTLTDLLFSKITTVMKKEMVLDRKIDLDNMDSLITKHNKAYNNVLDAVGRDRSVGRLLKMTTNIEKQRLVLESKDVITTPELLEKVTKLNEAKDALRKGVDEPTRTSYQNRFSLSKGFYKSHWMNEMEHFNQTKGDIKVANDSDMSDLDMKFASLLEALWSEKDAAVTDDIYSSTQPNGKKLAETLNEMREMARVPEDYLKLTQIMHDLLFYSRLCYTLLFLSNIKLNKEDFMYDNLGFKDVLLLVKGGKKVLGTKRSRLFKLAFPINPKFSWLYNSKYNKKVTYEGKLFVVLPWQSLRFTTLKLGTELYYSFPNYFISSYLESNISLEMYKKFISVKVLNMYSQRRKVETWFGFFRYLYLNSLSTHTSLVELLEDMVSFDYDPYFYYCQRVFAREYKSVVAESKKMNIYDMFTKTIFTNFDLCAEKFDEAFFMPKAPFERENEHMRNLKSVLSIQQEFKQDFGDCSPNELLEKTALSVYEDGYFENLFKNDFNFDPDLCFSVGKYAGDFISRSVSKAEMSNQFSKIMSRSYTKISTSKGMRSSEGHFWGSKGHDVVFNNKETFESVKSFVEHFPEDYKEFSKRVREGHVSFQDMIESKAIASLEFDMKDKQQWKGSREIYVMSDTTKLLQNPLESFFKYLCTWTPNELIHKPSHIRPKFIHSQVFEFSEAEDNRMFATLDCRKWAPKSNLWKYYFFIKGMEHRLPKEFTDYFYTVWSMMFVKKVRIQARYVEKLKSNKTTEHLCELLSLRSDGDYDMEMPYSFMMGIFNYLSSLLHAFGQLYFNDKIASKQGSTVNLIAHSDDSGGVFMSKTYEKNLLIYRQYEIFQKGLNHLMSKKKSSLSPKYFEMISIMYAESRLIPMTHKFLANVSFEPKGKGWVDDISTIVSKVVELYSNGATHLQCYLTMLAMGEMIRKFYHIPRLKNLSLIPLPFGGLFNLHPLHLIMLGADAQEVALDCTESIGVRAFRIKCYEAVCKDYVPGKGALVNYKIPYYKSHSFPGELSSSEMKDLKIVSSCISGETIGDMMGHYARIKDPAYVYSLEGVDMCQIFTTTLFSKTLILREEKGTIDLRAFTKMYSVLKEIGVFSNYKHHSYSQYHNYMKASEEISFKMSEVDIPSKKTCKPIVYSTFSSLGMNLSFKQVNEVIAYNSGEKYSAMFPDIYRLEALTHWAKTNLGFKESSDLTSFLMKVTSKDTVRVRSSYCFMPSGISLDTVERFWTYSLFYTSRRYFISSKKPQYFTIDQFRLWNSDYDSLKHYYFLLKLGFRLKDKKKRELLLKNAECPNCTDSKAMVNMLNEVERLKELPDWSKTATGLPFAVYHENQRRNLNVWYGATDFTLYTMFGEVTQSRKDGEYYYSLTIVDDSVLDQVWFLLRNFMSSRGILELQPEYGINDSADFKLGFDDLNKPISLSPGSKSVMIRNSKVTICEYQMPSVNKENGVLKHEDKVVDFEIYYNYDLNPTFYDLHGLALIKDLIFEDNFVIEKKTVINSMISSKLYKILMCDPTHHSPGDVIKKYKNVGLLGDERSFSRALALGDMKGVTSYKSSINPLKTDMPILENMSYKDIPVLDLMESFSFARLSFKERRLIQKLLGEQSIDQTDKLVMDRIVSKMGAKPTFNAITILKITFSTLSYEDVSELDPVVLEVILYDMLKAALQVIKNRPVRKDPYQFPGDSSLISNSLATMIMLNEDPFILGQAIAKICLRAQFDNAPEFWNLRRSNIYCGLIVPEVKYIKSQTLFFSAIVNHLLRQPNKLSKLLTIRQLVLAKNRMADEHLKIKKTKTGLEAHSDLMTGNPHFKELPAMNFYLDEDSEIYEDDVDSVSYGAEPEEPIEREWVGYDLETTVLGVHAFLGLAELTMKNDYSSVKIRTFDDGFQLPWLGRSDREIVVYNSCVWYEYTYRGKTYLHLGAANTNEIKIERKQAANIPILEPEVVDKPKGPQLTKEEIFKMGTDEEVYNYQLKALESIGIKDGHRYAHLFFRYSDVAFREGFWNIMLRYITNKAQNKKIVPKAIDRRSLVLPGFTGNLNDSKLRAELNALFSNHSEELVTGNHQITARSYDMILKSLKRMYKNASDTMKACIIVLLATMKDAVISSESDAWYLDSLLGIMSIIDEDADDVQSYEMVPPKPIDAALSYQQVDEYE
jgi:hypothetical protein